MLDNIISIGNNELTSLLIRILEKIILFLNNKL